MELLSDESELKYRLLSMTVRQRGNCANHFTVIIECTVRQMGTFTASKSSFLQILKDYYTLYIIGKEVYLARLKSKQFVWIIKRFFLFLSLLESWLFKSISQLNVTVHYPIK